MKSIGHIAIGFALVGSALAEEGFEPLFQGTDLSGWKTVRGKGKDGFGPFTVDKEQKGLHVYASAEDGSKQDMDCIYTEKEFSHYELKLEYKWMDKRFKPRVDADRDAGLLFHVHGNLKKMWPQCVEMQFGESDPEKIKDRYTTGDLWVIGKDVEVLNEREGQFYTPGAKVEAVGKGKSYDSSFIRTANERPHGEWNEVTLTVRGGEEAIYELNGKVVNRVTNMTHEVDGKRVPLDKGRIALQAEYAELMYRNIRIKELPDKAETSLHGRIQMPGEIPEGINGEGLSLDKVVLLLQGKYNHPRRPYPENWSEMTPGERSKWQADFSNSEGFDDYQRKVAAAQAKRAVFKTEIEEDGSFVFEDVPLAWYHLTATIMHPKAEGQPDFDRARAHAMRQFFVKNADEPQRLGTLTLKLKNVLMAGDAAPDFEATGYDGKKFRLSDYRGRFVLMDFWATWCGPCIAEMPNLEATHEALGGDSLEVIGLSIDDTPEIASAFLKKKPSSYLQGFLGQSDSYQKISTAYGIESIPAIWLIGPDGKIIARDLRGRSMPETVRKLMEKNAPQASDGARK